MTKLSKMFLSGLMLAAIASAGCNLLPASLRGKAESASPGSGGGTQDAMDNDNPSGKPSMPPEVAAAWEKTYEDAKDGLRLIEEVNRGNLEYVTDEADAVTYFDAAVTFDEACKKYNFPKYKTGVSSATTTEDCATASQWKKATAAYFPPTVKRNLDAMLAEDLDYVQQLTGGEGWVNADTLERFASVDAYMKSINDKYAVLVKRFGVTLDPALMAKFKGNAEAFVAGLAKAAKVARMPRGLKNPPYVKAWASKELSSRGAIEATAVNDSWATEMDGPIPKYKRTTAFFLVHPKGLSYCYLYHGDVRSSHEGFGNFGPPFVNNVEKDFQISACK